MLIKQKSPPLLRNLSLRTFGELPVVFTTKVYLLYLLFNGPELLFSASDKAELFIENFSKNSNLDGYSQVSLYLLSLLELI